MSWSSFRMGESLCANSARTLWTFNRLTGQFSRRIRNYIGKEWFLDLALKGEPSPLSHQIKNILGPKKGLPRDPSSKL